MGRSEKSGGYCDEAVARMGAAASSPADELGEPVRTPQVKRLSAEAAAFYERVWESAKAGCLTLLRRLGCSEAEAEEIFAEVYAKVMARVDPIEDDIAEAKMVNLLKVACRRQLIDVRRHEAVLREVAVPEVKPLPDRGADEPYESVEAIEAIEIGQEAVLSLTPRDRLVFQMRYQLELSPEEIQERAPWLTPDGYRKAIQRSNAKVLAAYEQIKSGKRCKDLDRLTLTRFISGAAGADLVERVEAHLKHCRHCRRSCMEIREYMHDVGSTLALAGAVGTAEGSGGGVLTQAFGALTEVASAIDHAAGSLRERVNDTALRLAAPGGESGLGQVIGASGVKAASLCAGVAAVACTAAGVVPGVGPLAQGGRDQPAKGSAPAAREVSLPSTPSAPPAAHEYRAKGTRIRNSTARNAEAQRHRDQVQKVDQRVEQPSASADPVQQVEPEFGGTEFENTDAPAAPAPASPSPPVGGGTPAGGGGSEIDPVGGAAGEFGP